MSPLANTTLVLIVTEPTWRGMTPAAGEFEPRWVCIKNGILSPKMSLKMKRPPAPWECPLPEE